MNNEYQCNNFGASVGPEDFGGSDYMSPEEEARYIAQSRLSSAAGPDVKTLSVTMTTDVYNDLQQRVKNGEAKSEFLQQLVDTSEASNIGRQGKIEALELKQEEFLHTVAQLKAENKKLQNNVMTVTYQKQPCKEVVDFRRVDQDLLVKFALAVLEDGYDNDFDCTTDPLEDEIREAATFHPHVQQEVVDVDGILRFRENKLVNRIVEEAGNGKGLNYIATIDASIEDRAQLAQLIGYSVSGYEDLSYSLPVEEDKFPT